MKLNATKPKNLVGLEIEAGSVAATEVRVNGSVEVVRYGVEPLAPGVFREGEVVDRSALAGSLKELFSKHKLSRNVRLGIANQRIAVRTLELPVLEDREQIEAAVRFQAQEQIPMPPEQAVLDWEVIGRTAGPQGDRMQVLVVAGRRDMLAAVLSALREANLRPVGIDLSAFGMIRALSKLTVPVGAGNGDSDEGATETPAKLLCNLGDITNIAVVRGTTCLFTRVAGFGLEGIAQKLAERRALTLEHSRQWLVHVGLVAPVEEIEGDAEIVAATRTVLEEGVTKLAEEIRRSLEYYRTQDGAVTVDGSIACGPGTVIEGLVDAVQQQLAQPFQIGRVGALGNLDPQLSARLTLPFGLALEN